MNEIVAFSPAAPGWFVHWYEPEDEVIGSYPLAGWLTVRETDTGELRVVAGDVSIYEGFVEEIGTETPWFISVTGPGYSWPTANEAKASYEEKRAHEDQRAAIRGRKRGA